MSKDSANNDPISSALNMVPMVNDNQLVNLIDNAFSQSAENDFNLARTNIMELIQTGTLSLERLAEIAAQSQHPRAFEVVSTMINTLLVANEKLLDMQAKIRQLNAIDGKGSNNTPQIINNNLFVGSTQELLKTLKTMKVDDDNTSRDA
jgi:predicted HTH domain antitoxin